MGQKWGHHKGEYHLAVDLGGDGKIDLLANARYAAD